MNELNLIKNNCDNLFKLPITDVFSDDISTQIITERSSFLSLDDMERKMIVKASERSINKRANDARELFKVEGVDGVIDPCSLDLTFLLTSENHILENNIGNATQIELEIDRDGSGQEVFSIIYKKFDTNDQPSDWEEYRLNRSNISKMIGNSDLLQNMTNGTVRVFGWNSFGPGDVTCSMSPQR